MAHIKRHSFDSGRRPKGNWSPSVFPGSLLAGREREICWCQAFSIKGKIKETVMENGNSLPSGGWSETENLCEEPPRSTKPRGDSQTCGKEPWRLMPAWPCEVRREASSVYTCPLSYVGFNGIKMRTGSYIRFLELLLLILLSDKISLHNPGWCRAHYGRWDS